MKKCLFTTVVVVCGLFFASQTQAAGWSQSNESGFRNVQNTSSKLFKVFGSGRLYAATKNENGIHLFELAQSGDSWSPVDSTEWEFLADNANTNVSVVKKYHGKIFLALDNTVSGSEVWSVEWTGDLGRYIYTTQVNEDNFGFSNKTDVTHFVILNDILYAFVDEIFSDSAQNTVHVMKYSQAEGSWTETTALGTDFVGLDSAVVFKGSIYVANGDPSNIYRSSDGVIFTKVTTVSGGINQLKISPKGNKLFALGTSRRFCYEERQRLFTSTDGETWLLMSTRPKTHFCYTQLLYKPRTNRMWFFGFDNADGVAYNRTNGDWRLVTKSGFGNFIDPAQSVTNNREISDGIWFDGHVYFATKNEEEGTQVWANL